VNLVDEQDIAVLEVGEERGQIARLGDDRAAGRAIICASVVLPSPGGPKNST
jgi:hypothetical protein